MEARADRHETIDRKHHVDRIVHCILEVTMDELKWDFLTEVQGRWQADLIKSYFEACGIEVELFQESLGQHIYPSTLDILGNVQLFVPKEQMEDAKRLLEEYYKTEEEE